MSNSNLHTCEKAAPGWQRDGTCAECEREKKTREIMESFPVTEPQNFMSPNHPHGKPDPRWITDDGRCLLCADSYHKQRISELTILCETLYAEMNWLDQNCSFVADAKYNVGPFKVGELRLLAQAGLKADEKLKASAEPSNAELKHGGDK